MLSSKQFSKEITDIINEPIKLDELPKIEEITAVGELKKLILDIFNFIISKLK